MYQASVDASVEMICVGTSEASSRDAVEFARTHTYAHAVVGVHPHDAKEGWGGIRTLIEHHRDQVVGIGEIGLDYFYEHSTREVQQHALREQLALAAEFDLPVSFHVRDAYDDFWPIFDEFTGVRGILHSFTDSTKNLKKGLDRGLFIGINGISTFTKDEKQVKMYAELPLGRIVLETDAPFLTPTPFRGKMNIPAYVELVAQFHADARNVSKEEVAAVTTQNAKRLFRL